MNPASRTEDAAIPAMPKVVGAMGVDNDHDTDADGGSSSTDIFIAHRPEAVGDFDAATIRSVSELNSDAFESPGWTSRDNCRLPLGR